MKTRTTKKRFRLVYVAPYTSYINKPYINIRSQTQDVNNHGFYEYSAPSAADSSRRCATLARLPVVSEDLPQHCYCFCRRTMVDASVLDFRCVAAVVLI